jgi:hypothetical protein
VSCSHDGFHGIRTVYDRASGVLIYLWFCEGCGERLREGGREDYRPSFDPTGNDHFFPGRTERVNAPHNDAQRLA